MARENIRHWKIGDVEIARIVEVNNWEDDIAMLLPDGKAEYVQKFPWLVPNFATPAGKMLISFQCFVLRSRDKVVMIDTCIGNDRQREYPVFCNMQTTFLEDLAVAGFPPASVNTVMCSHLHFDHVGWNTRKVNGKWVPTFPQARYLFGKQEYEHWQRLRDTGGYHDIAHLVDSVDPIIEAKLHEFIGSDHHITDEVWLEPTPGLARVGVDRLDGEVHELRLTGLPQQDLQAAPETTPLLRNARQAPSPPSNTPRRRPSGGRRQSRGHRGSGLRRASPSEGSWP